MSTSKSLPLAIGLNILLPGLGYAYFGRQILGILIIIVTAYILMKGFALFTPWLALNVIMAIDMLILSNRQTEQTKAATSKQCPQCAETVQKAALVCKHCGHKFASDPS
jgi:hypothetical protein